MIRTLLQTLMRFLNQPTHCISSDLTTSILNYSVCYTLPANLPIYSYRPALSSCTSFACACCYKLSLTCLTILSPSSRQPVLLSYPHVNLVHLF